MTIVRLPAALGFLSLAAVACTTEKRAAPEAGDSSPATAPVEEWSISHRGIGPLRVGATVAEARSAFGTAFSPDSVAKGCHHVAVSGSGSPGRVLAMVVDGRVVRVETQDSAVVTDRGGRVGDSESRIDSLYSGRVTVEPHKYVNGHYLIVAPEVAGDSSRIIFETDGARVTRLRAGLLPAVAWVEGCS
jgi:hypothetical protein